MTVSIAAEADRAIRAHRGSCRWQYRNSPCDPLTRGQLGTEGHGMSAAPIAASTAWPLELHALRGRDLAEVQQRQRIEELAEVTVAP